MKKLLLFLVLLVISCSKDDTAPQESLTKEELIGTWNITSATMNGASLNMSECYLKQSLGITAAIINYNGSYLTNVAGTPMCMEFTESHTYTIQGKQILIPNSEQGVNYRGVIKTPGIIEFTTNRGNGNVMIEVFSKN